MSAYELAVQGGYSGTVEQWLLSLKGEPAINVDEGRIRRLEDFLWVSLVLNFIIIAYLAVEHTFYGKKRGYADEVRSSE